MRRAYTRSARRNEILPKLRMTLELRYGLNPHQTPARVFMADGGSLPITVLNGAPGFINLLDGLNGWQLVRELRQATGLPAATSFKHVSPAGAAIGLPLTEALKKAYFVGRDELSPLAAAYARARGADRVSSYGDFVALSDRLDVSTAKLLRREVSDGVIAPAFEPEAVEMLKGKRSGRYVMLQIDGAYEPPETEARDVFGIRFEQRRNGIDIGADLLTNVPTRRKDVSDAARRDMLVALITLKYTQSNSVCLATDGQVIGNGAGQQSRIHCTRIAADNADLWFLRQHPRVLELALPPNTDRAERDNVVDHYVRHELGQKQKKEWLETQRGVTLGSDAYIPFRDNIDRAHASGVEFIVQPGGSMRDEEILAACDEYGMMMVLTGVRLFQH